MIRQWIPICWPGDRKWAGPKGARPTRRTDSWWLLTDRRCWRPGNFAVVGEVPWSSMPKTTMDCHSKLVLYIRWGITSHCRSSCISHDSPLNRTLYTPSKSTIFLQPVNFRYITGWINVSAVWISDVFCDVGLIQDRPLNNKHNLGLSVERSDLSVGSFSRTLALWMTTKVVLRLLPVFIYVYVGGGNGIVIECWTLDQEVPGSTLGSARKWLHICKYLPLLSLSYGIYAFVCCFRLYWLISSTE